MTTNHVHAMLVTYGVEACRATVMHEVISVFSAYGIGVDPRHLGLIADFMTHQVGWGCEVWGAVRGKEGCLITHAVARCVGG